LLELDSTIKQIAAKLGVCERTVKRDLAKIRPYYERRSCHYQNFLRQEQLAEFERGSVEYDKLSPKEKLKRLRLRDEVLGKGFKLVKQRKYVRHQLLVSIDLDDLAGGFPKIMFSPPMPFNIKHPFELNFAFKKNGVTTKVCGLAFRNQTAQDLGNSH
jgi:hypothetical protein